MDREVVCLCLSARGAVLIKSIAGPRWLLAVDGGRATRGDPTRPSTRPPGLARSSSGAREDTCWITRTAKMRSLTLACWDIPHSIANASSGSHRHWAMMTPLACSITGTHGARCCSESGAVGSDIRGSPQPGLEPRPGKAREPAQNRGWLVNLDRYYAACGQGGWTDFRARPGLVTPGGPGR